ncbi:hypothetical protein LOTGIDRAFT_233005 [Lottia gigantea]|uniref:DNA mismatch repair proteins mutS family domain-containing protein n=1 Tax=Lottia gigantea TaxID=225164 RepID=V4AGJ6_LOTGI|nr:hypothetical protein LOTGIDRAFT_233005 [Lottia gigantea]ESO92536.1 hypothetical protein LOTGIDRAFT_233005 [Lottia gigantea]
MYNHSSCQSDGSSSSTSIRSNNISRPKSRTPTTTSSNTIEDIIRPDDITSIRNVIEGSTDSETEQLYLSVVWYGGKLGLAYYDVDTLQIHVMLDTMETDDFSYLKRAIKQIEPAEIILSSKQDDRLLKALKKTVEEVYCGKRTDSNPASDTSSILQYMPSIDFSLEICKRRILSIDLPAMPKHYTDTERILYMSSLISFDNVSMVKATGGLLKFLEKKRIGVELESHDVRVPVLGFKNFSLEDQMILDDSAYNALLIFHKECHPSVYKSGTAYSGKEGLSLFAVSFFSLPRNIEVLSTLQDCMKHIRNIPRILSKMVLAQASIADWQVMYKTVYHAIYIGDICRSQAANIAIFKKVATSFSDDLHRIATLISKIIDFDESVTQSRFVVKPNVDAELDEKKRTYNGLPDFMTKVAREELNKLGNNITECSVIYLPHLCYLLAIPKTDAMVNEEDYEIPGLDFKFMSNNMLHYKSPRTRELDTLLGDTQCEIIDHETNIMHRLQNTILEHSKVLNDVMEYTAELDCLMSLSTCAREFGYIKPEMVEDNIIDVEGGRHPIQELCCSPFVPNDYCSNNTDGRIKILTGPNACGKSVYLKQIALIVYMAHIGSFVPAEKATIGTVDRIFTRIKSLESVSVGLSTFMLDITQMSEALNSAMSRSLILVDEFGKGTQTIDGLSLLCATLRYWLAMQNACPHVMVSTHFHSIVHEQLLPKSPQLKFLTLDTLHNGEDLVFLYQVVNGTTSSSYASHVASKVGLPEALVKRGIEVSELIRKKQPIQRLDSESTAVKFKKCRKIVKKFCELDFEKDDVEQFLNEVVLPIYNKE